MPSAQTKTTLASMSANLPPPDRIIYGNNNTTGMYGMDIFGMHATMTRESSYCYCYGDDASCDSINSVIVGLRARLESNSRNCTVYGTVEYDRGTNNRVLPLPGFGQQLPRRAGHEWMDITLREPSAGENPDATYFQIDMSKNPMMAELAEDATFLSQEQLIARYGDFFRNDLSFKKGILIYNKSVSVIFDDVYHEGRIVARTANGKMGQAVRNCAYDSDGQLVYDGFLKRLGPGARRDPAANAQ
jgi:hypothetical protein